MFITYGMISRPKGILTPVPMELIVVLAVERTNLLYFVNNIKYYSLNNEKILQVFGNGDNDKHSNSR